MRIALIADTFPPLRTSGAVQLRDLSREFARQGHRLTVILPDSDQSDSWRLEEVEDFQVLRLGAYRMKDVGYVRRTIAELLMPFCMRWNFKKSPLAHEHWDGVVWYAPSIFHGPFARFLKAGSRCKGYLIIRDIFPEWAVDMGLMGRGLTYRFFDGVARYQYSIADVIGVQTPGNEHYFSWWEEAAGRRLEVLQNWLGDVPTNNDCSIDIKKTALFGRKIFVYAGNMGVAQGMDMLLDLAEKLQTRTDVGFLFVGRGRDAARLRDLAKRRGLDNTLFCDEIHPDEIPALYAQCAVGMVSLDRRHKSHNIPGKFLTYMQSGLPVLASINPGNDLAETIKVNNVGRVSEDGSAETLKVLAEELIESLQVDRSIQDRCRDLFAKEFSSFAAVRQIVAALN